jgi:hypothetical protein
MKQVGDSTHGSTILDIYRVLTSDPVHAQSQVNDTDSLLYDILDMNTDQVPQLTQIVRIMCNVSAVNDGAKLLLERQVLPVNIIHENEGLRDAYAALAANLSLYPNEYMLQLIPVIGEAVNKEKKITIAQKLLLTLYRLITINENGSALARALEIPLHDAARRQGCKELVYSIRRVINQ